MNNINILISALCGFNVKDDPLIKAYSVFGSGSLTECLEAYNTIYRILALEDKDLSAYLRDMIRYSDSPVIEMRTKNWEIVAAHDAKLMERLSHYGGAALKLDLCKRFDHGVFSYLPEFDEGDHIIDSAAIIQDMICGRTGRFAKHKAYTFDGAELHPVENIDTIKLSDLKNYEAQRSQIIDNTECFVNGKPAQNVLLYGDRGTGKSSTVKALLHQYPQLCMIEVSKNDVEQLPKLYSMLKDQNKRFIIFIDDLTFTENDDRYNALKAALEGSLAARPENILIYATTNRRKIIKETTAERLKDEVSPTDAVDESMSLADRFGLFVTFGKPDKRVYLDIVSKIAADRGITLPEEQLFAAAERFAIRRSGRSPRIARQFVDWLQGRLELDLEI